jgi:uncharacterized protein (DUF58 family)
VLTSRGKDFLKAAALTLVASSIAGPTLVLTLGFALCVTACISLVALLLSSWTTKVTVEPTRLRTLKNEVKTTALTLSSRGSRFFRLESVQLQAPFGVTADVKQFGRGSAELSLRSSYAGRFDGFRAKVSATDPLGLFSRAREFPILQFVVESLPRALVSPTIPLTAVPLATGEIPAGRRGGGQELYSVEEYDSSMDTRDILWKKVARTASSSIPVRIREADFRRTVSIGVAVGWDSAEQRAKQMDLVCESIAQIGRLLIHARVRVEISLLVEGALFKRPASNLVELADAVVGIWKTIGETSNSGSGSLDALVSASDLLITDPREFSSLARLQPGGTKPTVIVSEVPDSQRTIRGVTSVVFSGREDLRPLVVAVLQR